MDTISAALSVPFAVHHFRKSVQPDFSERFVSKRSLRCVLLRRSRVKATLLHHHRLQQSCLTRITELDKATRRTQVALSRTEPKKQSAGSARQTSIWQRKLVHQLQNLERAREHEKQREKASRRQVQQCSQEMAELHKAVQLLSERISYKEKHQRESVFRASEQRDRECFSRVWL